MHHPDEDLFEGIELASQESTMRTVRALVTFSSLVFLGGCVMTSIVADPENVKDTGELNTVVLSYEIKLATLSRHPLADFVTANLCEIGDTEEGVLTKLTSKPRCFVLAASYAGMVRDESGVTLETFHGEDLQARQMKYGTYRIEDITYRVLADRQIETVCTETPSNTKSKVKITQTRCKNENKDTFRAYRATLDKPIEFEVIPGSGCYLGYLSVALRENDMIASSVDPDLETMNVRKMPPKLHATIRSHVTRNCDAVRATG